MQAKDSLTGLSRLTGAPILFLSLSLSLSSSSLQLHCILLSFFLKFILPNYNPFPIVSAVGAANDVGFVFRGMLGSLSSSDVADGCVGKRAKRRWTSITGLFTEDAYEQS